MVVTGSCLCGGVRFRLAAVAAGAPIQVCHCTQCRKAQGTPFATNMPVDAAAFTLLQGADLLREYESSPGKRRVFCSRCGAPVYSRRDADPQRLRLRAGLLDEPLPARPAAHYHLASRCSWWPVDDDGLPRHAGGRGEEPPG